MATKSMNTKNNGSKKPLVKVQKAKPMVTAYKQSPVAPAKSENAFNLNRNKLNPDVGKITKALKRGTIARPSGGFKSFIGGK